MQLYFTPADVTVCISRALTSLQTTMLPKTTCRPSKKWSPMMMVVVPPLVQPSLGQIALMVGVAATNARNATKLSCFSQDVAFHDFNQRLVEPPSMGSSLLALRPCFELLCTNMLSDVANSDCCTSGTVDMATYKRKK